MPDKDLSTAAATETVAAAEATDLLIGSRGGADIVLTRAQTVADRLPLAGGTLTGPVTLFATEFPGGVTLASETAIDCDAGDYFTKTFTAARTITVSNAPAGVFARSLLAVSNSATPRTLTFTGYTVVPTGATIAAPASTSGAKEIIFGRDAAGNLYVTMQGGIDDIYDLSAQLAAKETIVAPRAESTSFSAIDGDIVRLTGGSGQTVTLPATTARWSFCIDNASGNSWTVARQDTSAPEDSINGTAANDTLTNGKAVTYYCTGTNVIYRIGALS